MESNSTFDALPVSFGSSKPKKDYNSYKNRNKDNIAQIVENGFSKTYEFSNKKSFSLPQSESLFTNEKWEVNKLQHLKNELNEVKSKLNSYNLAEWHNHTRINNPAGTVLRALRKFQPEFLTQAWCKFFEIVSRYKLIPKQSLKKKSLNSIHLCEAPGAFIASLNHYLKLNHPEIEWKWLATTLNPYYEGNDLLHMVNDDRFIINTLENWWFGTDHTGNIYSHDYLNNLIQKVKKPVNLITADGSVNCLNDPAEQEQLVAHLHYAETICALNILERGGSFLIKIFTMFECDTICLLYLLRCSFTQINVFKPVTSKEGNSEVYVACLNYKGKDHIPILDKLNEYYYTNNQFAMFSKQNIPEIFIDEIINCATKFKNIQASVILRNIDTYESQNKRKRNRLQLMDIRDSTANMYIEKYKIRPIETKDFVVKNQDADTICLNLFPRDESGTFLERKNFKDLDINSMMDFYKEKLDSIEAEWTCNSNIYWYLNKNENIKLELQFGKPIDKIHTSKFCKGNLLNLYMELEDLSLKHSSKIQNFKKIPDYDNEKSKYINTCTWTENNDQNQKLFFNKLMDIYEKLEIGDNLILNGFPLLTQFSVGLIYILGQFFNKIGFVNPEISEYCVILSDLKDLGLRQYIVDIHQAMSDHKDGLLALVPITSLCETKFLKFVTLVNQVTLKFITLKIVESLRQT